MVMRTALFEKLNVSANSSFSLYGTDSRGRSIGTFYYQQTNKLMKLNNFVVSLDFSLSELLKGKEKTGTRNSSAGVQTGAPLGIQQGTLSSSETPMPAQGVSLYDEYGYAKFDVPWTMNVSYSLNYSKASMTPQIIQSLSVNGSLTLTKKMSLTYNSGYDFTRKEITMTQLHINRDLHCWEMSFDWIPNGYMKMWTFSIRVKAAVLSDLKYERRKDYHDNY
jgi:hypothetical protein